MPSNFFQRRGSRLVRRRMVQELSIKLMINYRQIRTRLRQGISCICSGKRFMDRSTSGGSSWSSIQPPKIFLPKSGHIPLFMSTFFFITVCLFLTGSRRFHQLLRRERQNIFLTMRLFITITCRLCGKYYSNKTKRGDVNYWLLCHV